VGGGRVRTEWAARVSYAVDFVAGGIDAACRGACKRELGIVACGVT
jgi:hypothetical protein